MDKPSKELVDQVVQASQRVTASQVPEFVGLAAAILKAYRARQDNTKEADAVSPLFSSIILLIYIPLENSRFSTINLSIIK